MSLKKLLRRFGMIVKNNDTEPSQERSRHALVFRSQDTHCYAIIDIPNSFSINTAVLKRKEIIVESHRLTDQFDESRLQKRIALLDHQLAARLMRKKN